LNINNFTPDNPSTKIDIVAGFAKDYSASINWIVKPVFWRSITYIPRNSSIMAGIGL
jgi:hypothetical protein